MADYLVTDTELTDVADAIRDKGGTSAALEWPTEYVDAIGAISASDLVSGTLSITENGTHDVTNYASVNVNISGGGGGGPYVVGNNTGSINNYVISPVVANENDTVTVKYTGSTQPLMPGMAIGITDANENTVVILKSSGMMTQNEQWTFTMPDCSVVVAWVASM